GTLYFASGNRELAIGPFEEALKIGEQTGGELPGYLQPIRLSLAIAYASARVGNLVRAKNLDRAKELATRAQAYYQDRVNRDPTEDIEARVYLAETQLFLEEFAAGAETLRVGRSLHPNDESLRAATARFNVAWYDALEQPGNGIALTGSKEGMDAFDKLELLSAALQMDPNYFPIFDRM